MPPSTRTTSADELEAWARRFVPGFVAVVSRDALPPLNVPGASFIINLDPAYSQGGTHWCAVRVMREAPDKVAYFDPFGERPPPDVTVNAWRNGRGVLMSDVQYQDMAQKNCGPRCLLALYDFAHAAASDMDAFKQVCLEPEE